MTLFQLLLRMVMTMLFTIKVMIILVAMGYSMCMGISIMGMRKCMLMLMGMIPNQRVHHHQNRSHRHYQKSNNLSNRQSLLKQNK